MLDQAYKQQPYPDQQYVEAAQNSHGYEYDNNDNYSDVHSTASAYLQENNDMYATYAEDEAQAFQNDHHQQGEYQQYHYDAHDQDQYQQQAQYDQNYNQNQIQYGDQAQDDYNQKQLEYPGYYSEQQYDDQQSDLNSTLRNNGNSYSNYDTTRDSESGVPPVPPPHRVSIQGATYGGTISSFDHLDKTPVEEEEEKGPANGYPNFTQQPTEAQGSVVSLTSLQERTGVYADRTPSPLRNAMDDVLNSLDNLELASSVASSPRKGLPLNRQMSYDQYQQQKRPEQILENSLEHEQQSRSHSPAPVRHTQLPPSPVSPGKSPKRKPVNKSVSSMLLPDADLPKLATPPLTEKLAAHSNTSFSAHANSRNSDIHDSDSDDIPFDPHSYSSSPTKSMDLSKRISHTKSNSANLMTRNDTYKSVSTVNTAALSITSTSTNPTAFSTSSGSDNSQKQRKEAYYRMEAGPGLSDNTNNDDHEIPVSLPTNDIPSNNRSSGRSSTTTQLKKSAGFLKKFFGSKSRGSSSIGDENKENNGRSSGFSFRSGRKSACSAIAADGFGNSPFDPSPRRQNGSSALSIKSGRSISSLSIRNTLRKVSSRTTVAGRNAFSSLDFHSGGSPMGISRQNMDMNDMSRSSSRAGVHDTTKWIEIYRNVHRTKTLSKAERETRATRHQFDGSRVLEPLEALSRSGNEVSGGGAIKGDGPLGKILNTRDFSAVDSRIFNIGSWPHIIPGELARGYIGSRFSDPLDQLRAAFDFCASKLRWESAMGDNDDGDYEHERYRGEFYGGASEYLGSSISMNALARVMQTRRASTLDISHTFKQMCDAFNIYCEVIPGYLKGIGEIWQNPGIPRPNHYWNAVLINDQWRMVDASLANPSFPTRHIYTRCDEHIPEYFYFLTRPKELIYTHVPYNLVQEHIVPLISHENAIALPLTGPSAFTFNIEPINFSTSLTRLEGLEVAEIVFAVPPEAEILAEVVAGNFPAGSAGTLVLGDAMEQRETKPALAQVFWEDKSDQRFYRVKAVLPTTHRQGALSIYIGARGVLQSVTKNVLSLAYSFPVMHTGENPAFNFVIRHPTPHSDKHDIYINEPQCRDLICGNTYVFSMHQHVSRVEYQRSKSRGPTAPIDGHRRGRSMDLTRLQSTASSSSYNMHGAKRSSVNYMSTLAQQQQSMQTIPSSHRVKMALQGPSGKILKLARTEVYPDGSGLFEGTAKCSEPGIWRGLIISDSGNAWSVFAEWLCS